MIKRERSDKIKNKAKVIAIKLSDPLATERETLTENEVKREISHNDIVQSCASIILLANGILEERLKEMSNKEIRDCIASMRRNLAVISGEEYADKRMVSKRMRFFILQRDKFTCQYCGMTAPDVKLHVDHKTPRSLGGQSNIDNLCTSCSECNYGKSNLYDTL